MKQLKQWNTASKSLSENIICALEGIGKYKYKMIVRYLQNTEHTNPMQEVNRDLNNPFSWKCISQFHREPKEIKDALARAVNDTERDLLQNWTWIFGEPEAIKIYEETGVCTAGLFKGIGTCSQVRIKDLIAFLKENGEAERAKLWEEPSFFNSGIWTPRDKIPYRTVAEGMTYAVYFQENDENLTIDKLNSILDQSVKEVILQPITV